MLPQCVHPVVTIVAIIVTLATCFAAQPQPLPDARQGQVLRIVKLETDSHGSPDDHPLDTDMLNT